MTLIDALKALHSDPADNTSPLLVVGDGVLSPAQREQVTAAAYARHPYCVVEGLSRGSGVHLHNELSRLTGGVQVHLLHRTTSTGFAPDGVTLAKLQALVARLPLTVTELTTGYPLAGSLQLVAEVDPRPDSFDKFNGLVATTRFQYNLWR